MAIPRGYRRGSGGFLQPIGRVPSGRVSGPPAGYFGPIGTGPDALPGLTREQMPATERENTLHKRILASYQQAQKQHEATMAKIAAAETARVDKLQKALEAERKNAPKDKLGNTIETPLAKYLAGQLGLALGQYSQRGRALTPGAAGITPAQQEKIIREGPGGPGGGAFEPVPGAAPETEYLGPGPFGRESVPGESLEPGSQYGAERALMLRGAVYPMNTKATHVSGAEITLLGQQRPGPNGPEYLARAPDGKTAWVPAVNFRVAEGAAATPAMSALERFYRGRKEPEDFTPF